MKMKDVTFDVVTEKILSLDTNGFIFNWHQLVPNKILVGAFLNSNLVGLIGFVRDYQSLFNRVILIEIQKENRGLGLGAALLSLVMQDSFLQDGFEGYVELISKSDGTEAFYKHLGGNFLSSQNIVFNTQARKLVVEKYCPWRGI
ncbi:GNAT family N-acetyltransferase [Lactobacillus buchneri]|nr:GNAT family N-acetyltransferase [Lentilactobacillus buchneri]MQM81263.1 GNAT family N-acetyltransferase [Lentilactobacillus buchneri]